MRSGLNFGTAIDAFANGLPRSLDPLYLLGHRQLSVERFGLIAKGINTVQLAEGETRPMFNRLNRDLMGFETAEDEFFPFVLQKGLLRHRVARSSQLFGVIVDERDDLPKSRWDVDAVTRDFCVAELLVVQKRTGKNAELHLVFWRRS